jgi:hypothetical protein
MIANGNVERNTTFDDLYSRLELETADGKSLTFDIREYINDSPFASLLAERNGSNVLKTKQSLVRTAYHMLVSEQWGTKWFGPSSYTAMGRSKFWPADSTL